MSKAVLDGVNFRMVLATALGGAMTLQAVDSASDYTITLPGVTATLADDSKVVHLTGTESITGIKDFAPTWNNGATVFTGLKLNVTDTASDANSLLMDLQVGGSSKFKITKSGKTTISDSTVATSSTTGALVVTGGVGVGGKLYTGGNLAVEGGSVSIGLNAGTTAAVALNTAAGNNRGFQFMSAGVLRWYVFAGNGTESGSDAGSAFNITAYTDAGSSIDTPFSIVRAAGGAITMARPVTMTSAVTINNTLTLNSTDFYLTNAAATNTRFRVSALAGSERGLLISTNSSARWEMVASSDAESGSDAGSAFMVRARNDSGTVIDSPINIARASGGTMTFGGTSARLASFLGNVSVATGKAYQVNGTQVLAARDTGWTAMTGTSNKNTAYDTATVTLAQLAGRVMAIQAALTTHGMLGA